MLAHFIRLGACAAVGVLVACSAPSPKKNPPPRAEFLLSSLDSTYWVATTSGEARVRGAPLVLARYDGRFYEVYSTDDDFSYNDALLVGERLYRRDIMSGDSAVVFADTIVHHYASAYAKAHPDERPLGPDEDGEANPSTSVTAQLDIVDVYGPYLSYEYHVDVELPGRERWHSTRQGVIDLRTGKPSSVVDLFGTEAGARLRADAKRAYESARDSMLRERSRMTAADQRAAEALQSLQFDDRSFTLSETAGRPAVQFGIPGHGTGPSGNVVNLEPLSAEPTAWWREIAAGFASADDAGADRWKGNGYQIVARYDTVGEVAHIAIADSTRREWPLANARAPLLQVMFLDAPSLRDTERRALDRAFNEAGKYDENARIALTVANRHANVQNRPRKPARNVGAHDARTCQQHGPCLRGRRSFDDGQVRGDLRVSAQPRQRGHGVHRPRRLSRAHSSGRPADHEGQCQSRRAKLNGDRSSRRGGGLVDRSPTAYKFVLFDVRCR